jgi:uncharacterized protein (TIGR02270 family)
MIAALRQPIPLVVEQHGQDAAAIRNVRTTLVHAPHVKLHHLLRFDERLAAHLDGLAVAGDAGWSMCTASLENPGVGEVFTAAVSAITRKDAEALERLHALSQAVPEAQPGLISAFGWVEATALQGTVRSLLVDSDPFRNLVGIAACAMHRTDPNASIEAALASADAPLRARALRCIGEIGKADLLGACLEHVADEDKLCAFWAGYSAVLLGNRGHALEVLHAQCLESDSFESRAFRLVVATLDVQHAHELLKMFARDKANQRLLIQGAGISGNPVFVPWLIGQMGNDATARPAGEAFSLISGADLAALDLERKPPQGLETGPNADAGEADVEMDADDGLPWPDPERVQRWWNGNGARFTAGTRFFVGAPITPANCASVLKTGYQRQRELAARHLCLMQPGTPLFNTSAPVWRQQRLLAQMG